MPMAASESWYPELEHKIVGILSASNRPLATNEVAQILSEPRHRVLRSLSRLRETKRVEGNQAKARGSWVWWLATGPRGPQQFTEDHMLEDVAIRLREGFGLM